MTEQNGNRSVILLLCGSVALIALGLLLNYFEVYELIFGIQRFSPIFAIPLYLSALIAGSISLGPFRASSKVLILSNIALAISISAWTPLVKSLPSFLFHILLALLLICMVVNGRINRSQPQ